MLLEVRTVVPFVEVDRHARECGENLWGAAGNVLFLDLGDS